jgi:hypothetical protein
MMGERRVMQEALFYGFLLLRTRPACLPEHVVIQIDRVREQVDQSAKDAIFVAGSLPACVLIHRPFIADLAVARQRKPDLPPLREIAPQLGRQAFQGDSNLQSRWSEGNVPDAPLQEMPF